MAVKRVLILGAGPSGLAAAIALTKTAREVAAAAAASPQSGDTPQQIQITLIEVRDRLQTIGGTIVLTPLAMRYLDHLGAGDRLRARGIPLADGMDYVSLRTGRRLGNIWGGIGAVRVARGAVVETLMDVLTATTGVDVQFGRRVVRISEQQQVTETETATKSEEEEEEGRKKNDASSSDGPVVLEFSDGSTLAGDVLLGCDGLHSAARRLWVEPGRDKAYSGRVLVMGFRERADVAPTADGDGAGAGTGSPLALADGSPGLRDTALVSSPNGILLTSYYEPTRSSIYFADAMTMDEPKGAADGADSRDGWKLLAGDQDALKRQVVERFQTGRVRGIQDLVAGCENWHLYPVYLLPPGGRWHKGRTLIMGDAAHAMPPQGESTGIAIEDAVLFAHVFQRHQSRSVEQLFLDFEALRRPTIDKYHASAVWAMEHGFRKTSWFGSILLEWGTWLYLLIKRWRQDEHFSGDVRKLELPE